MSVNEFQYQIDLLKALNQKLSGECNMYRTLVGTSSNAFLYISNADDKCLVMGNWELFFDLEIRNCKIGRAHV